MKLYFKIFHPLLIYSRAVNHFLAGFSIFLSRCLCKLIKFIYISCEIGAQGVFWILRGFIFYLKHLFIFSFEAEYVVIPTSMILWNILNLNLNERRCLRGIFETLIWYLTNYSICLFESSYASLYTWVNLYVSRYVGVYQRYRVNI